MKAQRIPLGWFVVSILVLCIALAALRNSSEFVLGCCLLSLLFVFVVAVVGVLFGSAQSRAAWAGLIIFGSTYGAVVYAARGLPVLAPTERVLLLTNALVHPPTPHYLIRTGSDCIIARRNTKDEAESIVAAMKAVPRTAGEQTLYAVLMVAKDFPPFSSLSPREHEELWNEVEKEEIAEQTLQSVSDRWIARHLSRDQAKAVAQSINRHRPPGNTEARVIATDFNGLCAAQAATISVAWKSASVEHHFVLIGHSFLAILFGLIGATMSSAVQYGARRRAPRETRGQT